MVEAALGGDEVTWQAGRVSFSTTPLTDTDLRHLTRCVDLAEEAEASGDGPFGSVLVGGNGEVLAEARNTDGSGDGTRHPELDLVRWAGENLAQADRPGATVYTSGEHCPMCSAAHAWVGLGRIVYACSAAQLTEWRTEWGGRPSPVRPLAIGDVAPGITVLGPATELIPRLRELHERVSRAETG